VNAPVVLQMEHFQPYVGKKVRFGGTPFVMPLEKIIAGADPVRGMKRRSFILIFRTKIMPHVIPEGSYEMHFEDGPTIRLHVMPIFTPEAEWQDYQAVFS
jgi:hypothetical protein